MTERLHFHFSLSCIGEGNGNPLQCSCLENPRDGGAWWAAVHGVAQSQTQLKRLSSSSMILCISVLSVVISPFSFLILLIWFFSIFFFFLVSLTNALSISFIFSKNQLLVSLIFAMVSFVSFSLISPLIFMISFLLLTLGFLIYSFSSCFRCRLFISLLSCFLR